MFWQVAILILWPPVIRTAIFSVLHGQIGPDLASIPLFLLYPASIVLLVRALAATKCNRWEMVLLHILITLSFDVIWYQVYNGYGFMVG